MRPSSTPSAGLIAALIKKPRVRPGATRSSPAFAVCRTTAADEAPTTTSAPIVTDPDAIDFGDEKPALDRDAYLLAAFTDIEAWLTEEFEPAFGIPFEPLQGEVYAGYPGRTDPISPRTP